MERAPEHRPLLRLPPVALPAPPPPGRSAERGRSLTARALLSVGLLLGVIALAVGIILALLGLNLAVVRLGRVNSALLVTTLAVLIALGRALTAMLRRPPEPVDEVEVPEADEPELYEAVRRLAAQVGTRPPDRVAVVAEVNAYVREFGRLLGLIGTRRTLAIGVPLLDVLDVSELQSVLAHELGHFAGGDTRLGPLTFRTEQALARIVQSLGDHWVSPVFVAYWRLQRRVSAGVRRGQELVADRASVKVAGRQVAADALQTVEIAGRAEALLHAAYLGPMLGAGYRPDDLAAGFRSLLVDPELVGELQADDGGSEHAPLDPWASHPPTPERIARIAALPEASAVARDARPARALLRDPDRWTVAANERWLEVVANGATLRSVGWDAWGEVVVAPEQRSRAQTVDEALALVGLPAGLPGLRAALTSGRDRDVAAALISVGWRTGGPDERDAVLRAAVAAAAAHRAVEAGDARWSTSWSRRAVLRTPAGEELPLREWVDRALAGDWAPLLAGAGGDGDGSAVGERRPPDTAQDELLPQPPSPPFQSAGDGWRWKAELPGTMWRKARLAVGDDGLAFGSGTVAYDAISRARLKLTPIEQGRQTAKFSITTTDGRTLELSLAATARNKRGAILAAAGYLWDLLNATVGPRLRAAIAQELRSGVPVEVAGLRLTREGVASRKRPDRVIPWSAVPDPEVIGNVLSFTPQTGPKPTAPLTVPFGADNAFLVPDLIPYLRALFA